MSVMNLADYSTVQVGPGCLPEFLEGLLASIRGPEALPEGPAEKDEPSPAQVAVWVDTATQEPPKAKPRAAHPRGSRRGG